MRISKFFYLSALMVFISSAVFAKEFSYVPEDGFVPDVQTAIKIAEAVWLPIYGERIYGEKPFNAELIDGVWSVRGTLHTTHGGVAEIEINKSDGKILRVSHGK